MMRSFVYGACLLLATTQLIAEEAISFASAHKVYGGSAENVRGFVDCMFMFRDERPVIAFGVQKRPQEKGRFLYVMLFRPDAAKGGFSVQGGGGSSGDEADTQGAFTIQKCELKVAYRFDTEEKSGKLKSETLRIDGKEVAADDPRVFLVDLVDGKAKFTPVKVALPDPPTDLNNEERGRLAFELDEAIKAIREKSPEAAKFLAKK